MLNHIKIDVQEKSSRAGNFLSEEEIETCNSAKRFLIATLMKAEGGGIHGGGGED